MAQVLNLQEGDGESNRQVVAFRVYEAGTDGMDAMEVEKVRNSANTRNPKWGIIAQSKHGKVIFSTKLIIE